MNSVPALLNHLDANRESPTLSLAYASISDDGVTEVAKFIRDNPFVKYLDLRGNNIQARGAAALANGIRINRSLRSLNLKWNSIGKDPAGLQALCDVLKSNLTIGHLDLRNNRINNVGAKMIAELLKANTTITHLDISWNDLGVDGGLALLEGLKSNTSLIDCQLSGSKVGEDTLHEVAFLLRRNRAAAAYKANPQDAGVKAAAADPQLSALANGGPTSAVARTAAEGDLRKKLGNRAHWTAKDSSTLLTGLLALEREQVLPEERLFYQQISEHIDKLLLETSRNKTGRVDAEEREKLATTGFLEREQRYVKEIRTIEDILQRAIADRETLSKDFADNTSILKRLNEESTQAVRGAVAAQEQAVAEEQRLRAELRELHQDHQDLQDKVNLCTKDLELLQQENERLRQHVKAFQRDVNEILA